MYCRTFRLKYLIRFCYFFFYRYPVHFIVASLINITSKLFYFSKDVEIERYFYRIQYHNCWSFYLEFYFELERKISRVLEGYRYNGKENVWNKTMSRKIGLHFKQAKDSLGSQLRTFPARRWRFRWVTGSVRWYFGTFWNLCLGPPTDIGIFLVDRKQVTGPYQEYSCSEVDWRNYCS